MPCEVELTDSFKEALAAMPERAQDQVAHVVHALISDCSFQADEAEFIIVVSQYVTACEHVEGWGWRVLWYREEGTKIVVEAERSVRERLKPKKRG